MKPNLGRIRTVDDFSNKIDSIRKSRRSVVPTQFRIEEVDDRNNQLITTVAIRKDALRIIAYALIQGATDERCHNPGMAKALGSQLLTIANFHDGPEIDPSRILVDQNGVGIVDEVYMSDGRMFSFQNGKYSKQPADEAADVDEVDN